MNLANKITLSRIILTAFFMAFLFIHGVTFKCLALITFIVCVFSDYLDGFVARKNGTVSDLGKIMDPVADKILIIAAFLAFVEMKLVPAWMVVVIILREFVITGLRITALTRNEVLAAGKSGKHKTVSQMISIIVILIFIIFREAGASLGFWNNQFENSYIQVIFIMMGVTTLLTLTSGISYVIGNKKYIKP